MKNKGMWVFRLSIGRGGNPKGRICPIDLDFQSISEYRRNVHPLDEEYDEEEYDEEEYDEEEYDEEECGVEEYDEEECGVEEYDEEEYNEEIFSTLKRELFEHGKLRQGWGYEFEGMNLNLNQLQKKWVENYMKLSWRLWGIKIRCKNATGRWNILQRMKNMEIEDVVFVPRIPNENNFTVATVKKKYLFQPMEGYIGHAHIIGVKNVKKYSYKNHFPPKVFNPYRNAVSQIQDDHIIFNKAVDFIESYYL